VREHVARLAQRGQQSDRLVVQLEVMLCFAMARPPVMRQVCPAPDPYPSPTSRPSDAR
jgi:hypothetical protein